MQPQHRVDQLFSNAIVNESTRSARRLSPVRHVVSITADVVGGDRQKTMEAAKQKVLKWLSVRVGDLPSDAWEGKSFEHMTPGRFAAGVSIPVPHGEYWTVRCDDPDKTIPGRTWTTEAALGRDKDHCRFGLRLIVATNEIGINYSPSIPGIVRQLSDSPGLLRNGRPISVSPRIVDSSEALNDFIELLVDPRRKNPVFAISLNENEIDPAKALVDAHNLATRCLGIAHTAVVTGPRAFELSDRLGKAFSVFRGAVRTYLPGMSLDDDPYRHPLAMAAQIKDWQGIGPSAFANTLVWTAAKNSSLSNDEARDLPPFTKAKQISLQAQRELAKNDSDYPALLALADGELKEKQREIESLESMVSEEEQKRHEAEDRANELASTNSFLRQRVIELERSNLPELVSEGDHAPTSYDEIPAWVESKYPGRLRLLSRAMRELKDAQFDDVGLVVSALIYLATVFWRMKTEGGMELVRDNEQALAELGIKNEPSGAEHLLREQGDTFLVQWGMAGSKKLLDMHLKNGGNTRDPARCLRIYYFWDDETQQILIGSLPAHLSTRAS